MLPSIYTLSECRKIIDRRAGATDRRIVRGLQDHIAFCETETVQLQGSLQLVKVCGTSLLCAYKAAFSSLLKGMLLLCREGCWVTLPPAF